MDIRRQARFVSYNNDARPVEPPQTLERNPKAGKIQFLDILFFSTIMILLNIMMDLNNSHIHFTSNINQKLTMPN